MRLVPTGQSGAIRAQLKQEKKLKLKIAKRVGKAFSVEEKAALLEQSIAAWRRSRGIHLATMLALHAGLRDKEIRTLQWSRVDLESRILTVEETKTAAGTGRTIPMNEELYSAFIEYSKWYTARFGFAETSWYIFPFGHPGGQDPTRHQTTLKSGLEEHSSAGEGDWSLSRCTAHIRHGFSRKRGRRPGNSGPSRPCVTRHGQPLLTHSN